MNMEKGPTNMGIKFDEEKKEKWEQEILDIGEKLGYPKEEMEKDIQEVKRLEKEMSKGGGEWKKEKLERNLALEKFIIEKMYKWDLKAEINEDEEIITATNKFDDYKNGSDICIYDEERGVALLIDATTSDKYDKVDEKITSITEGIDSEPQNYEKLNYHKKDGNKNLFKQLGHLKYPNLELLEEKDEKSIKKIPLKNIPRVVVNINRQTLKDYEIKEKKLKKNQGNNGVISLKSFENENQVKWEIFKQIDKQLEEQVLRTLKEINKITTEKKFSSVINELNLEEELKNTFRNSMEEFSQYCEEYEEEGTPLSEEKITNVKKETENFTNEIIDKIKEKKIPEKNLDSLEDKLEKLTATFKTYQKYHLINKRVQELRKEIIEKDSEEDLDSDWRKFEQIDYQRKNSIDENLLDKDGKFYRCNPIYNHSLFNKKIRASL